MGLLRPFRLCHRISRRQDFPNSTRSTNGAFPFIVCVFRDNYRRVRIIINVRTTKSNGPGRIRTIRTIFTNRQITIYRRVPSFTTTCTYFRVRLDNRYLYQRFFFKRVYRRFKNVRGCNVTTYKALMKCPMLVRFRNWVTRLIGTNFRVIGFDVFVRTSNGNIRIAAIRTSMDGMTFRLRTRTFNTFVPIFPTNNCRSTRISGAIFFNARHRAINGIGRLTNGFLCTLITMAFFSRFSRMNVFHGTYQIGRGKLTMLINGNTSFTRILRKGQLTTYDIINCNSSSRQCPFTVFLWYFFRFFEICVTFRKGFRLYLFNFICNTIRDRYPTSLSVSFNNIRVKISQRGITLIRRMKRRCVFNDTSLINKSGMFGSNRTNSSFFRFRR